MYALAAEKGHKTEDTPTQILENIPRQNASGSEQNFQETQESPPATNLF